MPNNPLHPPPEEWYVLKICQLYGCTPDVARRLKWDEALVHLELDQEYRAWEIEQRAKASKRK
jgi:hypothetical protein